MSARDYRQRQRVRKRHGNGSGTVGTMDISATVINAGLIEGTTPQGLFMDEVPLITNSGTIELAGGTLNVEVGIANSGGMIQVDTSTTLALADGATITKGNVALASLACRNRAADSVNLLAMHFVADTAIRYAGCQPY